MNTDIWKGKWKQATGTIKEKWADLTDDEIAQAEANREILEGKIQEKYGKTKDEAKKEVDDFIDGL